MINHFDDFCLWAYVVVDDCARSKRRLESCDGPKIGAHHQLRPLLFSSAVVYISVRGQVRVKRNA